MCGEAKPSVADVVAIMMMMKSRAGAPQLTKKKKNLKCLPLTYKKKKKTGTIFFGDGWEGRRMG